MQEPYRAHPILSCRGHCWRSGCTDFLLAMPNPHSARQSRVKVVMTKPLVSATFPRMLLLIGLLVLLFQVTPTSAGRCRRFPPTPCGEITNQSGKVMTYTTSLGKGPDVCNVSSIVGEASTWNCKQEPLPSPGHRGGRNVDVDAFTFNDEDYYIMNGHIPILMTKGVWTKIYNMNAAWCYPSPVGGHPWCTIGLDIH